MSDELGRHTNRCDYCDKRGYCPQCKGRGFVIEDLDKQIRGLRKGDILLIKSRWDIVGWIIRRGTRGHFNHCAWVIDKNTVSELKAKGKKTTPLKKYLNKWLYKCKAVRLTIDKDKLNQAINKAEKSQFNYSYSSSLVNYLLIKLKITKELPRLSCSGFIGSFLAQVGFRFCDKDPEFITPKDIEESPYINDVSEELYQ